MKTNTQTVVRDTKYYNQESLNYTSNRYSLKPNSFVQYIFSTRRIIFTKILANLKKENIKNILEVACADGVQSVVLSEKFPQSRIIANDIAADMIEVAKKRDLKNVEFYVRGQEPELQYDLIAYLGVYNALNIEDELQYVSKHLNTNGKFVVSFTHKDAFTHKLKPTKLDASHLHSICEYEEQFRKYFNIEKKYAHSLFIPHLWKLPFALSVQKIVEAVFSKITNRPFHEQIYVMSKKTN